MKFSLNNYFEIPTKKMQTKNIKKKFYYNMFFDLKTETIIPLHCIVYSYTWVCLECEISKSKSYDYCRVEMAYTMLLSL